MPRSPVKSDAAASESHVVDTARFKLLPVTSRVSIKEFVEKNGITFAPGRGFYQLTKAETIQAHKEIVAVRKSDGLQVTGAEVRDLLKIDSTVKKFKYVQQPDFDVFVQSTSYNRVLMPDTQFLYEVSPIAGSPTSFGGRKTKRGAITPHSEKRKGEAPVYSAGSPIDLVFSFDTTGSMYTCLDLVRKNLKSMITRILNDVPNIRIAVFAHGDYCDRGSTYVTEHIDFTVDKEKLVKFVTNVAGTGGGDWEECYELVLQEAREKLSWTPDSQRAMVMIGDAIPHSVEDYKGHYKSEKLIDWRKEADELLSMGCRVYSVQYRQSMNSHEADKFFGGLAYKTFGHHLELTNWDNVLHFIMAIAFCESGPEHLEAYKQEIIKTTPGGGALNADLHDLFNSLAGGKDDGPTGGAGAAPAMTLADLAKSKSTGAKKPAVKGKPTGATKGAAKAPAAKKRKADGAETTTAAKKGRITAKKPAVKKPLAKSTAAKKSPSKKAPSVKASVKKTSAKKTPAKKVPAKKVPAKKVPAKKVPAKKAPAKKAPAKKAPAKKAPAKKAPAKRVSSKSTAAKGRSRK